jgi:transcriptional regulator with XRE-family HTH domain
MIGSRGMENAPGRGRRFRSDFRAAENLENKKCPNGHFFRLAKAGKKSYDVCMAAAKNKNLLLIDGGIDLYIGQRIKLRRDMLGITQKQLAEACGVSFQQIQKYESGETRLVAERLYRLGLVLDIPVSFLFSGLPNQTPASDFISVRNSPKYNARVPDGDDPLAKNESLELIKLYWNLPNEDMRDNFMRLLRSMQG